MCFDALAACHPCPRPLDLCECLVRNFTPENGLILDCFAGAGTIPLAVQRIGGGRRSVAIEKNPTYCRLIEERLAAPEPQGRAIR
jgi:site-specific DNA-methyltransferase (adenine-specific)